MVRARVNRVESMQERGLLRGRKSPGYDNGLLTMARAVLTCWFSFSPDGNTERRRIDSGGGGPRLITAFIGPGAKASAPGGVSLLSPGTRSRCIPAPLFIGLIHIR